MGFAFFVSPYLVGPGQEWLYCPHDDPKCVPNEAFIKTTYVVPKFVHDVPQTYVKIPNSVELYPLQLHAIVLALFASLIAPFGGFLASAIKRAYEAKVRGQSPKLSLIYRITLHSSPAMEDSWTELTANS